MRKASFCNRKHSHSSTTKKKRASKLTGVVVPEPISFLISCSKAFMRMSNLIPTQVHNPLHSTIVCPILSTTTSHRRQNYD